MAKVKASTRHLASGKVVQIAEHMQERDSVGDALKAQGRTPIAAKPGTFPNGRSTPGNAAVWAAEKQRRDAEIASTKKNLEQAHAKLDKAQKASHDFAKNSKVAYKGSQWQVSAINPDGSIKLMSPDGKAVTVAASDVSKTIRPWAAKKKTKPVALSDASTELVELAAKGVRVIRTNEGARRYKAPIGSVIVKHPDGSHDVVQRGDGQHIPTNTQARRAARAGEYRTDRKATYNTKKGPRVANTSRGLAYNPDELRRHKERATRIAEKYADPTGRDAARQGTKSLHSVTDAQGKVSYTPERQKLHRAILDDIFSKADAAGVKKDRKAVVAAGLPGAGKGTVLGKHAGIKSEDYLTLDPDSMKEHLSKRGGVIPGQSSSISALDLAGVTHEESSDLMKAAVARAEKEGYNIVHDVTLGGSNAQKHVDSIKRMKKNGYTVHGVLVDIDKSTSTRRAEERYIHGRADYAKGKGLGGRLVPESIGKEEAPTGFKSVNAANFDKAKAHMDSWDMWDNNVDGRDPQHVASSKSRKVRLSNAQDELSNLIRM